MSSLRGSERTSPVVLVTGATGFVGGALACELMDRTDAELLFLVRAENSSIALERLRSNLRRFGASSEQLGRITSDAVLCGGLGSARWADDSRLSSITHVANCAALVSFSWDREVWRTNVEETEAFATHAARLPKLQRFLHVSTALISGATSDRLLTETDVTGDARQFTLYTKSKAEIERRLRRLLAERLVIARPSVVVGHSRLGCEPSGSIFWLFRMIHAAGRIPFPPQRRIDVVPVDYCARALATLLLKTTLAHDCYHVSGGADASCAFGEIDHAFFGARDARPSRALEIFDISELSTLVPHFQDWFGRCDSTHAARAIRVYTAFAGLDVRFDNTRLLAEGLPQSPRFCDYLDVCAGTAGREPIAEQMAYDIR